MDCERSLNPFLSPKTKFRCTYSIAERCLTHLTLNQDNSQHQRPPCKPSHCLAGLNMTWLSSTEPFSTQIKPSISCLTLTDCLGGLPRDHLQPGVPPACLGKAGRAHVGEWFLPCTAEQDISYIYPSWRWRCSTLHVIWITSGFRQGFSKAIPESCTLTSLPIALPFVCLLLSLSQGISYLFGWLHKLNMSTATERQEMKGKITRLQNHVLNFTVQFLYMEDRNVSLLHPPAS